MSVGPSVLPVTKRIDPEMLKKLEEMLTRADVSLSRVWVPPHMSVTGEGHPYFVRGYWREGEPSASQTALREISQAIPAAKIDEPKYAGKPTSLQAYRDALNVAMKAGRVKAWQEETSPKGRTIRFHVEFAGGEKRSYSGQNWPDMWLDIKSQSETGVTSSATMGAAKEAGVDVSEPVKTNAPTKGVSAHTTKSLADLRAKAEGLGIPTTDAMSKLEIMDAIRMKIGTFDPAMQIDPAKCQDLKHQIDWTDKEDPFKNLGAYLNDQWVIEPKYDGARFRLYLGEKSNSANTGSRSTGSMAYTPREDNFPWLRDMVIPELAGTILDGELLPPVNSMTTETGTVTKGSLGSVMALVGSSPAKAIATQNKYGKAKYVVFDVLAVKGEDVTRLPYDTRRQMLEMIMEVISAREPSIQIAPQMAATKENLQHNLDIGLEGSILKKRNAPHEPGKRMATWLKVKRMSTGDFYIIGSVPGKSGNAGKVGSLKVAYRGPDGKDVYVADVAGFDEAMRDEITDPETGDVKKEYIGRVIEVMAQGRTKNNRLRHPHFVRWRDDKTPEQTDVTQFELFAEA